MNYREAMLRMFVGVPLAPGLDRKFGAIQADLRRAQTHVSWVEPESLHLTVKFIGDFPASRIDFIAGLMTESLAGTSPTCLSFRGVSFFPNERFPKVIKVDASDESGLMTKAHTILDSALLDEGIPSEGRPYHAHLTLGRVKNTKDIPTLVRIANAYSDTEFGSMDVSGLVLFATKLDRSGPRYTVLAEVDCPDPGYKSPGD
ncbi:MAG: RNA 2',3'-cyclic phosphodiesterase [Candidatus Brocadiia bacterium]